SCVTAVSMSATDRPAPSSSKEASSGSGAASERSPVGASGVSSSIGLWTGSRGSDVVMPGEVGGANLSQDTPGAHAKPRPASVLVGGLGAPSRVPRPGGSPAGPVCQVPAWGARSVVPPWVGASSAQVAAWFWCSVPTVTTCSTPCSTHRTCWSEPRYPHYIHT